MTPDKRLNQLEPVVADVVQKVDRLIEGNGQIIHEVSKIPNIEKNVSTIATGLAELTITVNQQFTQVDQQFAQVDQQFARVDQRFDQQQQQIDSLREEMQEGFQRLDAKIDQRFDQIVALIQDRLK